VEEMNERIISVTNQYVKKEDLLINLGDMCLPRKTENYIDVVRAYLQRLTCKNVILVGGNHDKTYTLENGDYIPNWELWDLFDWQEQCNRCKRLINRNVHVNKEICPYCSYTVFNRVESVYPHGYELRITKKTCCDYKLPNHLVGTLVVCSHYAYEVWNKSHHGSIHVHGHSHGKLPTKLKNRVDVGFNIWNRPLSIVEIVKKGDKI
jgi:calcineurin-like phosphoesterase family protein